MCREGRGYADHRKEGRAWVKGREVLPAWAKAAIAAAVAVFAPVAVVIELTLVPRYHINTGCRAVLALAKATQGWREHHCIFPISPSLSSIP